MEKLLDKLLKARYLGKPFGVPLFINYTFFIPTIIYTLSRTINDGLLGFLSGLMTYLSLGAIIIAHEYGHVWMAKQFGIGTKNVTLYFFGGLASISKEPDVFQEIPIALAGPMVNFVLASITILISITTGWGKFDCVHWFVIVNLFVGAFNLIFMYPLDGSRVMRSFIALALIKLHKVSEKVAYRRATKIMLAISTPIAWAFILFGLYKMVFGLVILGILSHVVIHGEQRRLRNG